MKISKEQSFIIAKRLKELRESSGLSHEKLSKALKEQCGCSISADSLMNYEAPDEFHTKKYKNLGMKIESLLYLATFYGVSSDYILGLTDIKADNFAVRKIAELTGISEDNVNFLINPPDYFWNDDVSKYRESMYALVNLLFSCIKNSEVSEPFQNIYVTCQKELHATEDTIDIFVETVKQRGFEVLTGNQYISFRAGEIAENIKKEIVDKYRVEEKRNPTCKLIVDEQGDEAYVE